MKKLIFNFNPVLLPVYFYYCHFYTFDYNKATKCRFSLFLGVKGRGGGRKEGRYMIFGQFSTMPFLMKTKVEYNPKHKPKVSVNQSSNVSIYKFQNCDIINNKGFKNSLI